MAEERVTAESERWSSTAEDSPFSAEAWKWLSGSAPARRDHERLVVDSLKPEREMASVMRRWQAKTRAAVAGACDRYPSCREVELLRAVADEVLAAGQSVQFALAQSLERGVDGLEEATVRWLREGGRWDYDPGPPLVWREPDIEFLDEPWPVREASGTLAPGHRPVFVDFARTVREVGGDASRLRASIVGGGLRVPVFEGGYFAARDRNYQDHMRLSQAASVWLGARLERALDGVAATALAWWRHGEWQPPPRPRLIWGRFWEDGAG
jgi:hypothetical protein